MSRMPMPIPADEPSALDELREQYEVERELAARLRSAPRDQRRALYCEVYEELARRQPDRARRNAAGLHHAICRQRNLLEPFLSSTTRLLEIGAADLALALELCQHVHSVRSVQLTARIPAGMQLPANLHLMHARGGPLELNRASVDLAYSCHFVEHLHPEDALGHAADVHRILVPGGRYVCVTPNRLLGPHDVSRHFSDTPCGLHLREYSHGELADLLIRAGFEHVRVLQIMGQPPRQWPVWPYRLVGSALGVLPRRTRLRLLGTLARKGARPLRPLEQVAVVGRKASGRPAPQLLPQTRSASAMVR